MGERVVATGIGIISPFGIGKEIFLQALQLGESGVNTIKSFDASSFSTRIAAEVDFNPEKLLSDYI